MPRATSRPAQLDDPEWLAHAYRQHGTPTIAKQLGVSRKRVRLALQRHGITAHEIGRRRGATPGRRATDTPTPELAGTLALIVERYQSESKSGGPAPTETLLAARIRAAHQARQHSDPRAYEDALLSIASAAGLVLRHQRRLRGAE